MDFSTNIQSFNTEYNLNAINDYNKFLQGHAAFEIETEPSAEIHYTPGIFEIYLKNKGSIRRWVTMNEYDIYA